MSQAEWKRVVGNKPEAQSRPVQRVSWEDCQEFCRKMGLRLPTEAEWEYACRAGTTGPYAGTGNLDEMGWHGVFTGDYHPVGEKQPNQFGLYDMHGNVAEWCENVYDPEFYGKPEATRDDPVCTSDSDLRVIRGGSWILMATGCRSASRGTFVQSLRYDDVGFRPCYSLP